MAINDRTSMDNQTGERITAFFTSKEDAFQAVSELKSAGFTSDQIGLAVRDESDYVVNTGETTSARNMEQGQHDKSFWQGVKDFFTGDDATEDYGTSTRDLGWEDERANYYDRGLRSGGAVVTVTGPRAHDARNILESRGADLRESGFETSGIHTSGRTDTSMQRHSTTDVGRSDLNEMSDRDAGDQRIQLRGEILRTYKERVQRGEVRLRKEVVTENRTVDVPVTREELVIERVPTPGEQTASGEIGTDQEIRVPLQEEQVRVDKQQVVNEEVRVGKRKVQDTRHVSDDVRHEELRVEKEGDVRVGGEGNPSPRRKKPAA